MIKIEPKLKLQGFTIVELLIVIVVIGILAAITVAAFNGVQTRAQNTARINEIKNWHRAFETYKAQEGNYPTMPDGGYCLGVGFLQSGGVGKCRDYQTSSATAYLESDAAPLLAELRKVSSIPKPTNVPANGTLGPYAQYTATHITLMAWIKGGSGDCPAGTQYSWDDGTGNRVSCRVLLTR